MYISVHLWFKTKTLYRITAQSSRKISDSSLFSGLFYVAASRNNSPHVNSLVKTPSDVYRPRNTCRRRRPENDLRPTKKATEASRAFSFLPQKIIFGSSRTLFGDSRLFLASSGLLLANSGLFFRSSGPLLANSASLLANSALFLANSGPLLANSEPLFANSAPLLANSESLLANSGVFLGSSGLIFQKLFPIRRPLVDISLTEPRIYGLFS